MSVMSGLGTRETCWIKPLLVCWIHTHANSRVHRGFPWRLLLGQSQQRLHERGRMHALAAGAHMKVGLTHKQSALQLSDIQPFVSSEHPYVQRATQDRILRTSVFLKPHFNVRSPLSSLFRQVLSSIKPPLRANHKKQRGTCLAIVSLWFQFTPAVSLHRFVNTFDWSDGFSVRECVRLV